MKKHLLIIGIISLFLVSAITPIAFGSNIRKSNEESMVKSINFDSYHISEITSNTPHITLDDITDSDIIESNQIDIPKETPKSLVGPMDSDWPMYQHDAANTGYSQASFPNSFNQIWNKSYEEDLNITMISMFTSPVTSNGKLYIAGDFPDSEQEKWSSIILALNQSNGSLIWKKVIPINDNAGFGFQSFHSPAVYEGKIFTVFGCFFTFMSKSKIVALDENTGDILWEKSFFGTSWYSSVTVADDKVFVGGHFTFFPISWLYVFDADNGDLLWRKTLIGYLESTPVVYENKVFVAAGPISGLVLFNNALPLFSGKSRVYAFDIDDGQEIWMKQVKGHLVQCSPVAVNGKLFVPSNMFILRRWWICRISALDIETGEEIWYHDMNQEKGASWPSSISTPSVAYGKVFVTDSDGWLRVWSQESGDLIWKKEIYSDGCCVAFASPVIIDGKVIVGANANSSIWYNELFMFNESSGEYIWNIKLDGDFDGPFIVSNEMLFANDGWNGIFAFG